MRGTHEHSPSAVIIGGPDKPGHDGEGEARAAPRRGFVLFVFFVVPFCEDAAILAPMDPPR
jgi:hypothetical protein